MKIRIALAVIIFIASTYILYLIYPSVELFNRSLRPINANIVKHYSYYRILCNTEYDNENLCNVLWDHYVTVEYVPEKEYTYDIKIHEETFHIYTSVSSLISEKYRTNRSILIYYNICAFNPKRSFDAAICMRHNIRKKAFLKKNEHNYYIMLYILIIFITIFIIMYR